jgi:hypothetical protein
MRVIFPSEEIGFYYEVKATASKEESSFGSLYALLVVESNGCQDMLLK